MKNMIIEETVTITKTVFVCDYNDCGFQGERKDQVLNHGVKEHLNLEEEEIDDHTFYKITSEKDFLLWVKREDIDSKIWKGPNWYGWGFYNTRYNIERKSLTIQDFLKDLICDELLFREGESLSLYDFPNLEDFWLSTLTLSVPPTCNSLGLVECLEGFLSEPNPVPLDLVEITQYKYSCED